MLENCLLEPIDRPTKTPYGLLAQGRSDVTFTSGQTKGFAYTIMFTDGANGTVSDSFLEGAGHSVVTLHKNSKVAITHNILARCGYHAVRNTGGTMDMKNNLIIDKNRAGAYLGNRSAPARLLLRTIFLQEIMELFGLMQVLMSKYSTTFLLIQKMRR